MAEKVYLAFYKGRKTGRRPADLAARFIDWVIRTATRSPYSHCEIAVKEDGQSHVCTCYSASPRDGGVRVKVMPLPPEKWDLVEMESIERADLAEQFNETRGEKYDLIGAVCAGLDIPWHSSKKWFCSEWCGYVVGLPRPQIYTPAFLAGFFMEP